MSDRIRRLWARLAKRSDDREVIVWHNGIPVWSGSIDHALPGGTARPGATDTERSKL